MSKHRKIFDEMDHGIADSMYKLAEQLYPIPRSITGAGVRRSLQIISEYTGDLRLMEVPSGEKCFDWIIPNEWNIRDAYVINPEGKKIIDFQKHNLHVVNYSIPVNQEIELEELDKHLYSIKEQPKAIPYVTPYYNPRWGFA